MAHKEGDHLYYILGDFSSVHHAKYCTFFIAARAVIFIRREHSFIRNLDVRNFITWPQKFTPGKTLTFVWK